MQAIRDHELGASLDGRIDHGATIVLGGRHRLLAQRLRLPGIAGDERSESGIAGIRYARQEFLLRDPSRADRGVADGVSVLLCCHGALAFAYAKARARRAAGSLFACEAESEPCASLFC